MNSPAHPDSVNARLANYLNAHRTAIVEDWMQRAGRDPGIPTESLTGAELKGHLPALFNDLEASLRYYGNESVANLVEKDAAELGMARWIEGYSLPEMLREIAHLRSAFMFHLCAFEEMNPDFGIGARLFTMTVVHRFLDDLGICAADEYLVANKMDELLAPTRA